MLRAIPNDRAIARSVAPHSCLRRKISRTRRIDTLSAGIAPPARHGHDEQQEPPAQRSSERHPKGGQNQFGMAEIKSESVAAFIPESGAGLFRNQHSEFHSILRHEGVDGLILRRIAKLTRNVAKAS